MPEVLTLEGARQLKNEIQSMEEAVRDHNQGKAILPDAVLRKLLDDIYGAKCFLGSRQWNPSRYYVEILK